MSYDALLGQFDFADDLEEPPAFAVRAAPAAVPVPDLARPTWLSLGPLPFDPRPELIAEAARRRGQVARVNTHGMVEGGPAAAAVQRSPELLGFLAGHLPAGIRVEPTTSYYHWYATAEDRVEPHRDQEDFFLGCILVLEHEHRDAPECRFFLHPPGGTPIEVPMQAGDAVVFFSGAVTHSRSRPGAGERVTTLTFGFRVLPCD